MEKEIINEICQNAKKYEIIIIKLFAKIFVKAYHTGRLKCLNNIISKWLYQTEYGGPDGELGASLRYLSQRFAMPDQNAKAILNDVGTEELAHLEMVGSLVHQLTEGVTIEELEKAGLSAYYTDHGVGLEYIQIRI